MRSFLISTLVVVLAPVSASGQAARIGRLPLLDSLSARHSCEAAAPTSSLRKDGVARVVLVIDSATGRRLSVGVDDRQRPTYFSSMMGTNQDRRRESESITVLFRDGRAVHGDRSAFTTGTPTRLSDDRRAGLLAEDTARVSRLAAQVIRRCS